MTTDCTGSRFLTRLENNTVHVGQSYPNVSTKCGTRLCAERGSQANPCAGTLEALEVVARRGLDPTNLNIAYGFGEFDDDANPITIPWGTNLRGQGPCSTILHGVYIVSSNNAGAPCESPGPVGMSSAWSGLALSGRNTPAGDATVTVDSGSLPGVPRMWDADNITTSNSNAMGGLASTAIFVNHVNGGILKINMSNMITYANGTGSVGLSLNQVGGTLINRENGNRRITDDGVTFLANLQDGTTTYKVDAVAEAKSGPGTMVRVNLSNHTNEGTSTGCTAQGSSANGSPLIAHIVADGSNSSDVSTGETVHDNGSNGEVTSTQTVLVTGGSQRRETNYSRTIGARALVTALDYYADNTSCTVSAHEGLSVQGGAAVAQWISENPDTASTFTLSNFSHNSTSNPNAIPAFTFSGNVAITLNSVISNFVTGDTDLGVPFMTATAPSDDQAPSVNYNNLGLNYHNLSSSTTTSAFELLGPIFFSASNSIFTFQSDGSLISTVDAYAPSERKAAVALQRSNIRSSSASGSSSAQPVLIDSSSPGSFLSLIASDALADRTLLSGGENSNFKILSSAITVANEYPVATSSTVVPATLAYAASQFTESASTSNVTLTVLNSNLTNQ